jgi:transcriptional regulator with XRE-family HTH domain
MPDLDESFDFECVAAELMRALRGRLSQEALARRLGCRSHAIYTWEAGRNFPTAARMFAAAAKTGMDPRVALQRFYRRPPAWLATADPTTPATVARLLDDLRGATAISAISEATGSNRFAVARWLRGHAQPRLPDFLRLLEATSLRLLDFIACLVEPARLPSIADRYRNLEATRRAAYELPWSHAFLRALELSDYQALPSHKPGWLAMRLGLPAEDEARSLQLLSDAGQIELHDGRYRPTHVTVVDTRRDADAARRLRRFFSTAAAERLQTAPEHASASAYNLFGVSRVDLDRLRELQRAYFRQMRAIIADSEPVEAVVLANMQLVELTAGTDPDASAVPKTR